MRESIGKVNLAEEMIVERPANLVETYKTCKNKHLTHLSKDAAKTSQRVSCYCFRETHICSV